MCGGESKRMQRDKGLLLKNGQTWAALAAQKLANFCPEFVFSINKKQLRHYSKLFNIHTFVFDNPIVPFKGPLLGVLSVHLQHPQQDLLVLACDLPDIDLCILEKLLAASTEKNEAVCCIQNSGQIEPLVAIYKATGLARIWHLIQQNQWHKASMLHVLSFLETEYLPVGENEEIYFKNYNYPE